jgi:hypothetical protein
MSERSSMFEKNPVFHYRHGLGKAAFNRSNARATPFGCGFNMDIREARYGKVVAQFTIQTLYASVLTPTREIQISSDLGFLSL